MPGSNDSTTRLAKRFQRGMFGAERSPSGIEHSEVVSIHIWTQMANALVANDICYLRRNKTVGRRWTHSLSLSETKFSSWWDTLSACQIRGWHGSYLGQMHIQKRKKLNTSKIKNYLDIHQKISFANNRIRNINYNETNQKQIRKARAKTSHITPNNGKSWWKGDDHQQSSINRKKTTRTKSKTLPTNVTDTNKSTPNQKEITQNESVKTQKQNVPFMHEFNEIDRNWAPRKMLNLPFRRSLNSN